MERLGLASSSEATGELSDYRPGQHKLHHLFVEGLELRVNETVREHELRLRLNLVSRNISDCIVWSYHDQVAWIADFERT